MDGLSERTEVMDENTTNDFIEFLMGQLDLSADEIPPQSEWAGSGNTLGSIGLRLGLFSFDQVDEIITRQSSDNRLFGEIGISLKIVTAEQVDHLLTLQRFHCCLDVGASLVVEGRVTLPHLLTTIRDYLDSRAKETE